MPAKPAQQTEPAEACGDLIAIYQCLCDETRLRILNLLSHAGQDGGEGPLCVCHFQGLLEKPQVFISKHLSYLKAKGLVQAAKRGNWMIYTLPAKRAQELENNLRCLQDCTQTHPIFKADLRRLKALKPELQWMEARLAEPPPAAKACRSC